MRKQLGIVEMWLRWELLQLDVMEIDDDNSKVRIMRKIRLEVPLKNTTSVVSKATSRRIIQLEMMKWVLKRKKKTVCEGQRMIRLQRIIAKVK